MARVGNRGVSTALGYVFTFGISAVLVTLLLTAAGTLVAEQRESAVRAELESVGDRVTAGLEAADRLALASDEGTVTVTLDLQSRVAGRPYTITLEPGSQPVLVLTATNSAVTVRVPFETSVPVTAVTVTGGTIRITYDGTGLEVANA